MDEQQPKFHEWFHKFLTCFALWVFPLFGVVFGIQYISFARENRVHMEALIIILSVLLILASLFCIKARFDLAAFRRIAIKEILGVCFAAAAAVFLINFLLYNNGDKEDMRRAWDALILVAWGIAIYRYYSGRSYVFKD